MKFNELSDMMQKPEPKPDTYEAGMALNQLLKIGTHAIKIHNMIDDDQEMEAWVAKKIDLASNYVKSVHGYTAGSKAGTYDDDGMSEMKKMPKGTGTVKSLGEDAGEGHMSKSQLYQTAKMAIELLDMINKGDDLEGWVQTKLNLAADYLQAVYHYEDYQKLNPYREEIDSNTLHRHAGIIQKHLDEILERKCRAEDVDTKPGMMRILKKRVNEVEKEMAKKMREDVSKKDVDTFHKKLDKLVHKSFGHSSDEKEMKKEDIVNEDPRAVGRALANLKYAKAMANGIMKGDDMVLLRPKAEAFLGSADETIELLDKMYSPVKEEQLDEGIREWAKKLAMAGVVVAGLAGIGSINDA